MPNIMFIVWQVSQTNVIYAVIQSIVIYDLLCRIRVYLCLDRNTPNLYGDNMI